MRTFLAAAVLAAACVAACAGDQGKKTPEEEFGEKWLFVDLLKQFNDSDLLKKAKVQLKKAPSEKYPGTMYFAAGTDQELQGVVSVNDDVGPSLWGGFGVSDLKTRKAAAERASFLRDRRNEASAFSWGRYVFRGPADTLRRIKPLLP